MQGLYDAWDMLPSDDERLEYLVALGGQLAPMTAEDKTTENAVLGCAANVWIAPNYAGDKLDFAFASDAKIVSGLLFILSLVFNGKTRAEALEVDADAVFKRLGLDDILTSNRIVGVASAVEKIKNSL